MLRLLLKLMLGSSVLLVLFFTYVCAPFWTAWTIREAVTHGDTAYLERKVEWASVRETMRESMTRTALDLPDPDVLRAEPTPAPRRGLWARIKQRAKAYAGRRVVDKMVDAYISAEGLPRLYQARRSYRQAVDGVSGDSDDWTTRFKQVWARVKRAEFKSMTSFEIEILDQFSDERSYLALLELNGREWILTELRIKSLNAVMPVATAR